jgi:hypothetical protein
MEKYPNAKLSIQAWENVVQQYHSSTPLELTMVELAAFFPNLPAEPRLVQKFLMKHETEGSQEWKHFYDSFHARLRADEPTKKVWTEDSGYWVEVKGA